MVRSSLETKDTEFLLWGLGVMLAVHIVNWFGIIYFDQMYVIWFMQLAAISTLSYLCVNVEATASLEEVAAGIGNIRQYKPEIAENLL